MLQVSAMHTGRPHTPTDQAHSERFLGHLKGKRPHLEQIHDPGVPTDELDRVRHTYNTVRHRTPDDELDRVRHTYNTVRHRTPDDEHQGRGELIRKHASK